MFRAERHGAPAPECVVEDVVDRAAADQSRKRLRVIAPVAAGVGDPDPIPHPRARSYVGGSARRNLMPALRASPNRLARLHEGAGLRAASTASHSCSRAYPLLFAVP